MPKIELYYDEVYAGPDCLIAWNNEEDEEEELTLTAWWDGYSDNEWAFAPGGARDWVPSRFQPKAMAGETLTHWWDAIGALWHRVSHLYPLV